MVPGNNTLYATNQNGDQMYGKNIDLDEIYENTSDKHKIFAIRNSEPVYAKKRNGDEYYPKIDGADVLIETSDGYVYAKYADGDQMYPKDKDGNEIPIEEEGITVYIKTSTGQELYPRLSNGDEVAKGKHIIDANGSVEYPNNSIRYSKYPLDNSSDEYFLKNTHGSFAFGTDPYGNEIYAKKRNGDEFYPEDNSFAWSDEGLPIYALTNDEKALFPKDEHGKENYLVHPIYKHTDIIFSNDYLLMNYAKSQNGDEMYPTVCVGPDCETTEEIILGNSYAKISDFYYPLDAYGNEYTLPLSTPIDEKEYFPMGYPITNDSLIIIPNWKETPYITDTMFPKVTEDDVIAKIYRKNEQYDFLTNKSSQRRSRYPREAAYFTLPLTKHKYTIPETNSNIVWIMILVALLVGLIMYVLFLGVHS